jgi:2-polyprenyl-3-methyl-5-hydroxy-6-metoxy-1,4-benzoquinol methylase
VKLDSSEYEARIQSQIAQYAEPERLIKLGPIYHYWMNKHIRPRIAEVFGVPEAMLFYGKYAAEAFHQAGAGRRLLSLGSGECAWEIGLIKQLLKMGETDFVIEATELSSLRFERARANAVQEGVEEYLTLTEVDLNTWVPSKGYSVVIAKDTLHHLVSLEHIFDAIHEALEPDGLFLTTDMIGRNGHMRWPEALEIIQGIWRFMPDRYKTNHQLKRIEKEYDNWDCSKNGFEGIRAQDILPLLVEKFTFRAFLGFGNLTDIFIERGFGHNLSTDDPHDTSFIDFLEQLNTLLIDLDYLKPTMMYAVMTGAKFDPPPVRCYRHWTPEFCVRSRPPTRTPDDDKVL